MIRNTIIDRVTSIRSAIAITGCLSHWDRLLGTDRAENAECPSAMTMGLTTLRETELVATLHGLFHRDYMIGAAFHGRAST